MFRTQQSSSFLNPIFPLKFSHFPLNQTRPFTIHSSLLNFCTKPIHLQQIHARFILHGLDRNPTLSSKLIDFYANLGFLHFSKQIFNSISSLHTILYSTILKFFTKFGDFQSTLSVYKKMCLKSMYPDEEAYPFVLASCSSLLDVVNGKVIHGHLTKLGFESFYLLGAALIEMYSSSADFENERHVDNGKSSCDLSYWNSLIFEASKTGNIKESFLFYKKMRMEKVIPDSVTVSNLLRSIVDLDSLREGKAIHCVFVVYGLCEYVSVNTALLSMYSKFSALANARLLFDKIPEKDCVVWNIMISAYSQNGYAVRSIELLRNMAKSRVRADMFTALPVVSSIRQLKSIKLGKEMHAHVIRNGFNYQVSGPNSLIDMYSECDCLNYAQIIFNLLENKTAVSWSTLTYLYNRLYGGP